jgi:hypothetical protein
MAVVRPKTLLLGSVACLIGLLVSIRDVADRDDAPMLTLLLLIAGAGLLSLIRPGRAWQWALLIGIWPALVHLGVHAAGGNDHFRPDTLLARLALLPLSLVAALVGSYSGVVARHILLSTDGSRR